jgi:hypothetical protein
MTFKCSRWLFIILVSLTMAWFSEKMLIFNICRCGLMPNLIKKSWTVSTNYRHPERKDLCENVIFGAKWQNQGNYRCSIMLTKFNCIVVVQYFFPSKISNLESFLFPLHNIWKSVGIIFLGWSLRWCLKKANKI